MSAELWETGREWMIDRRMRVRQLGIWGDAHDYPEVGAEVGATCTCCGHALVDVSIVWTAPAVEAPGYRDVCLEGTHP